MSDGFLSLDLSKSNTGYAYFRRGGNTAQYGSWRLGSEFTTDGGVFAKLHQNLAELRQVMPFGAIYYEQTINPANLAGNTNIKTLALAAGLAAHVESFSYAMGCRAYPVNISTWRGPFLGRLAIADARRKAKILREAGQKASATRDLKMLCKERCQQLGFKPRSDDEADAIEILTYALDSLEHITPPWLASEVLRPPLGLAQ